MAMHLPAGLQVDQDGLWPYDNACQRHTYWMRLTRVRQTLVFPLLLNVYMQLDFGSVVKPTAIQVTAREDCCFDRAAGLDIYVSATTTFTAADFVTRAAGATALGETYTVKIPVQYSGRCVVVSHSWCSSLTVGLLHAWLGQACQARAQRMQRLPSTSASQAATAPFNGCPACQSTEHAEDQTTVVERNCTVSLLPDQT